MITPELTKTLVDVLNAQSGISRIDNKDEYKEKLKVVQDFLNTSETVGKDGQPKLVYNGGLSNKPNEKLDGKSPWAVFKTIPEVKEAAENHLKAAKARVEKAKEKEEAKKDKPVAQEEPSLEALSADIVKYLHAKTELLSTGKGPLSKEEEPVLRNRVARLLDKETGGLSNKPTQRFNEKSPWEVFKKFPGVKEAAKAHQKAVASNKKVEEIPM